MLRLTSSHFHVYGLAEDGLPLYAQVTHAPFGSEGALKKAHTLKVYGYGGKAHLTLFCRGGVPPEADGITRVSCDREVLPWVLGNEKYREALFGS
jgi:hypothetical protein